MAVDGSRGPLPYEQRLASTLFLRIPYREFRVITSGRKTEFRASPGKASQLQRAKTPTPVVAYMKHPSQGYDKRLMVLEETWQEPLGAIRPESLERENQPDIAHFRRYWMQRTRRAFTPTRMVVCYRVRPWRGEADERLFQRVIFRRLYGAFT